MHCTLKGLLNLLTKNNVYSNLRLQLIITNESVVLKGPMILLEIVFFLTFIVILLIITW